MRHGRGSTLKHHLSVNREWIELLFGFTLIVCGGLFLWIGKEQWLLILGLFFCSAGLLIITTKIWSHSWHLIAFTLFYITFAFIVWFNPYNAKFETFNAKVTYLEKKIENLAERQKDSGTKKQRGSAEKKKAESQKDIPNADNRATNPKPISELLSTGEFIITFVALIVAVMTLFFAKKVENLFKMEERLDEVSRLTVINAELALAHLPDFTESHQISYDSLSTIKTINSIVFQPGSSVLDYLDRVGNGVTLRYAKALSLFAENKHIEACHELENIKDKYCKDGHINKDVIYRLGIIYREMPEVDYVSSVKMFCNLMRVSDRYNQIRGKYGIALTLFSLYKALYKDKHNLSDNEMKIISNSVSNCLQDIDMLKFNINKPNTIKNVSGDIIKSVLIDHPLHYSAILYNILIPSSPKNIPDTLLESDPRRAQLDLLLRFLKQEMPESFNIRANYFVVEALSNISLGKKDDAKKALVLAKESVALHKLYNENMPIFSDISIRHISAKSFNQEIEGISYDI